MIFILPIQVYHASIHKGGSRDALEWASCSLPPPPSLSGSSPCMSQRKTISKMSYSFTLFRVIPKGKWPCEWYELASCLQLLHINAPDGLFGLECLTFTDTGEANHPMHIHMHKQGYTIGCACHWRSLYISCVVATGWIRVNTNDQLFHHDLLTFPCLKCSVYTYI